VCIGQDGTNNGSIIEIWFDIISCLSRENKGKQLKHFSKDKNLIFSDNVFFCF